MFATNASVSYSCLETPMAGEGNIVANPLFVDESNGDYHLALGSPCFDAGTISNVNCLEDMDGKQRIKGRSIDMGCYEFQDVPEMPIIIPSTGTIIAGTTNVVISCSTDDATIYYTTDGSEPTMESTVYRRFRVLGRTTVKAVAIKNGVASEIAVAEYAAGQCADPVITPVNGVEFEHVGQAVTIAWSGEDGVLRYTTDGSDPTAESPIYNGPFTIDNSTVVKAKAFGDQFFDSAIVTANLTRVWATVAMPTIAAASSFTGSETKVSLSCATPGATIYYTLNGSDPNSHSTRYTGPFYVTDSCTVKAYATCYDYLDSAVTTHIIAKVWGIGDTVGAPDHTFTTGGDLPFVRVTDNTAPLGESMKSGPSRTARLRRSRRRSWGQGRFRSSGRPRARKTPTTGMRGTTRSSPSTERSSRGSTARADGRRSRRPSRARGRTRSSGNTSRTTWNPRAGTAAGWRTIVGPRPTPRRRRRQRLSPTPGCAASSLTRPTSTTPTNPPQRKTPPTA